MDSMTVNYHAGDETEVRVAIRSHGDGSLYFVIDVGQNMNGVTLFCSPAFAIKLQNAIKDKIWKKEESEPWKQGRVPTEAEAMFIGMVEKELEEEGSCP